MRCTSLLGSDVQHQDTGMEEQRLLAVTTVADLQKGKEMGRSERMKDLHDAAGGFGEAGARRC